MRARTGVAGVAFSLVLLLAAPLLAAAIVPFPSETATVTAHPDPYLPSLPNIFSGLPSGPDPDARVHGLCGGDSMPVALHEEHRLTEYTGENAALTPTAFRLATRAGYLSGGPDLATAATPVPFSGTRSRAPPRPGRRG